MKCPKARALRRSGARCSRWRSGVPASSQILTATTPSSWCSCGVCPREVSSFPSAAGKPFDASVPPIVQSPKRSAAPRPAPGVAALPRRRGSSCASADGCWAAAPGAGTKAVPGPRQARALPSLRVAAAGRAEGVFQPAPGGCRRWVCVARRDAVRVCAQGAAPAATGSSVEPNRASDRENDSSLPQFPRCCPPWVLKQDSCPGFEFPRGPSSIQPPAFRTHKLESLQLQHFRQVRN